MAFFELSMYTGNEKFELQKTLVSLVGNRESLKVNYLIQACLIHIEFLKMKEKGERDACRQQQLQENLRKNPYEVKVNMSLQVL